MDQEKEKPSAVQNVAGEHHKVVGGNIFYGDAHFHIHGDTTSKKEEQEVNPERVESGPVRVSPGSPSAGSLDPEVEQMLNNLSLMSLKTIFVEEELSMSDLARFTDDHLKKIGVQKMKHRIAILDEVKARIPDVSNNSKCTGSITLSTYGTRMGSSVT